MNSLDNITSVKKYLFVFKEGKQREGEEENDAGADERGLAFSIGVWRRRGVFISSGFEQDFVGSPSDKVAEGQEAYTNGNSDVCNR